jgi:hypothetical protein
MDKFIIVFSSAGVARASTSISGELDPETITSEVIDGAMDRDVWRSIPLFWNALRSRGSKQQKGDKKDAGSDFIA